MVLASLRSNSFLRLAVPLSGFKLQAGSMIAFQPLFENIQTNTEYSVRLQNPKGAYLDGIFYATLKERQNTIILTNGTVSSVLAVDQFELD